MNNLQLGSKGPDVMMVQALLKNRGYSYVNPDGSFGTLTQDAVKDFEVKNGLTPTGVVTDALVNLLRGVGASTIKGVDVSHWNGAVNWANVAADGYSFCYIKATEGTSFQYPITATQASGAQAAGLKVGYYHFANPDIDPQSEVNFFNSVMSKLPPADLIPVLDIEVNKSNLSPVQMQNWISTFVNGMYASNQKVMLYSYTPFLEQYLPANHPFGNLPIWLAQYINVEYPKMPHGWTSYTIWQYSNTGPVNGIGQCDVNKCANLPLI